MFLGYIVAYTSWVLNTYTNNKNEWFITIEQKEFLFMLWFQRGRKQVIAIRWSQMMVLKSSYFGNSQKVTIITLNGCLSLSNFIPIIPTVYTSLWSYKIKRSNKIMLIHYQWHIYTYENNSSAPWTLNWMINIPENTPLVSKINLWKVNHSFVIN